MNQSRPTNQSLAKFLQGHPTTGIFVKPFKELPPRGEEPPQSLEFIPVDTALAGLVKHLHHHLDCVGVKGRVVSIH